VTLRKQRLDPPGTRGKRGAKPGECRIGVAALRVDRAKIMEDGRAPGIIRGHHCECGSISRRRSGKISAFGQPCGVAERARNPCLGFGG